MVYMDVKFERLKKELLRARRREKSLLKVCVCAFEYVDVYV